MNAKTPETLTFCETESLLYEILNHSLQNRPIRERVRNHCILLLMLDAGLRLREVTNLRQSRLIFEDKPVKTLMIPTMKRKGYWERRIPVTNRLSTSLYDMYNMWWSTFWRDPANFAFYMDDRRIAIDARYVQRFVSLASDNSIGYKTHPHVLRHTFASRLMRITNIRVVQELLGHCNIQSTQVYTHPNGDDLEKAILGLDTQDTVCKENGCSHTRPIGVSNETKKT